MLRPRAAQPRACPARHSPRGTPRPHAAQPRAAQPSPRHSPAPCRHSPAPRRHSPILRGPARTVYKVTPSVTNILVTLPLGGTGSEHHFLSLTREGRPVRTAAGAQSAAGRPGSVESRADSHAAAAHKRSPARSDMMMSVPTLPILALGRSSKHALHRASRAARSARRLRHPQRAQVLVPRSVPAAGGSPWRACVPRLAQACPGLPRLCLGYA